MTYEGLNHKFTISDEGHPVECYLKLGFVDDENTAVFPHLEPGEICFVDLTVSNKTDETKGLEIMFQVITAYIKAGGKIETAIGVMKYQRHSPVNVSHDNELDLRGSICDYIGRYLEGLKND